jgi:CheY-like chemotaxis protein
VPRLIGLLLLAAAACWALRQTELYAFTARERDGLSTLILLIGNIYAVMFALVIFVIWGQFTEVENFVMRECNSLNEILRFSQHLDPETGRTIRRAVEDYAHRVAKSEWNALAERRRDRETEKSFSELVTAAIEMPPAAGQEAERLALAAHGSSLDEWRQEARRLELQGKQEQADAIRTQILKLKDVPWQVLHGETLRALERQAFDSDDKQAKLLLFEYALVYQDRTRMQALAATLDQVGPRLKRLLVIEDNEIERQSIVALLGHDDIEIVTAGTGAEGIQKLLDGSFDCCVLDLRLPDMDGTDAARMLAQQARTASIPVVALTSVTLEDDPVWLRTAGFAGYLAKPIPPATLLAEVDRRFGRPTPSYTPVHPVDENASS